MWGWLVAAGVGFVVRGVRLGFSLSSESPRPHLVPKGSRRQACEIIEAAGTSRAENVSSIFTAICIIVCKTYRCSFESPGVQQSFILIGRLIMHSSAQRCPWGFRGVSETHGGRAPRSRARGALIRNSCEWIFPPEPPRACGKLLGKANVWV